MTLEQFVKMMPKARPNAGLFVSLLNSTMQQFEISTPARQAALLVTVAHESLELTKFEEGWNYSADALARTWPQRIANRACANREGNGDEASGDGWRNRGACATQLTFENNHAACARFFGIARDRVGDWLRQPEGACRSAGWFWSVNRLNTWADARDFDGVCDVVNKGKKKTVAIGDAIGWEARKALYETGMGIFE